jgi:hypothetical protein
MEFRESRTVTASKLGTFEYKCSFHPEMRSAVWWRPPRNLPVDVSRHSSQRERLGPSIFRHLL